MRNLCVGGQASAKQHPPCCVRAPPQLHPALGRRCEVSRSTARAIWKPRGSTHCNKFCYASFLEALLPSEVAWGPAWAASARRRCYTKSKTSQALITLHALSLAWSNRCIEIISVDIVDLVAAVVNTHYLPQNLIQIRTNRPFLHLLTSLIQQSSIPFISIVVHGFCGCRSRVVRGERSTLM